jgi:hypothetical protein
MKSTYLIPKGQEAEKVAEKVRELIANKEQELGVKADLQIRTWQEIPEKKRDTITAFQLIIPIEYIAIGVGIAFAEAFLRRFGQNLADWLSEKLKIKRRR